MPRCRIFDEAPSPMSSNFSAGGQAMSDFSGRVAIVTGAGSGIGAACAARFGADGATVVLLDQDGDALERERRRYSGEMETHTVDITDLHSVNEIVRSVA